VNVHGWMRSRGSREREREREGGRERERVCVCACVLIKSGISWLCMFGVCGDEKYRE